VSEEGLGALGEESSVLSGFVVEFGSDGGCFDEEFVCLARLICVEESSGSLGREREVRETRCSSGSTR
jgi:hypothetical protein